MQSAGGASASAEAGKPAPFPTTAWPSDTYFTGQREFFFNGESVAVIYQPAAHTDGDSIVLAWETEPVGSPGQAPDYVGVYQIVGGTGPFADATGKSSIWTGAASWIT